MGYSSSIRDVSVSERLIVALDVPSLDEARSLVEKLGSSVNFYKIGLELFMSGSYFECLKFLKDKGKKVFADLKFFDIPETVKRAVNVLADCGVDFISVHGNDSILEGALAGRGSSGLKVLAVTVLTSLDNSDIRSLGFNCDIEELVLSRAKKALNLGCDGVISSGLEVKSLKSDIELSSGLIFVCPGIRPVYNDRVDDQKRVAGVQEAFRNGADYIVVGRPVRDAERPQDVAERIQGEIEEVLSSV